MHTSSIRRAAPGLTQRFAQGLMSLTGAAVCAATLMIATPAWANRWAAEAGVGLNGTTLTYYPRLDQAQCHVDCANNPNCRGATWIQAGTYGPRDAAMCYQLAGVSSRFAKAGHVSMVKTVAMPSGGDAVFRPPHVNGVPVDNCAVWGQQCGWGGAHQVCRALGYASARSFQLNRPGRTYVLGTRQVCQGAHCVGFSEVVCSPAGAPAAGQPPAAPVAPVAPVAPATPAAAVSGHWQWVTNCPEAPYGGLFGIGPLAADGSFKGGFENGNGDLQGRVQGDRIEFLRTLGGLQQRWSALLSAGKMVQGVVQRPTEGRANCSFTATPYR